MNIKEYAKSFHAKPILSSESRGLRKETNANVAPKDSQSEGGALTCRAGATSSAQPSLIGTRNAKPTKRSSSLAVEIAADVSPDQTSLDKARARKNKWREKNQAKITANTKAWRAKAKKDQK